MSKAIKDKTVPKLRFPEFKEEWYNTTLGAIANLIYERAGSNEYTMMSITSGVGLISQLEKFGREIAGAQYKNYYVIKKSDFAYNKSATKLYPEGYIAMLKDLEVAAVPNSIFTCFRVKKNDAIPSFLDFLFYDNFHGKWLRKFIEVGARAHGSLSIDNDILFKMPLRMPSLPEQQKIASCLSSLDELITAQSEKLEALKGHKKGLMQQLFPAEGETVPKLRFRAFKDSGEWEEKKLDELGQFTGGGTPSKSNESFWQGRIPWVSSSDIDEESIFQIKIRRFITDEAVANSATKKVPPNSILLVSRVGVGKLAFTKETICTSQDFTNFTPDKCNLIFLAYYLKSIGKILLGFSQGMAIKGFTKDDISQLEVFIPLSKNEQQKISSCLSSLDELITAQAEKIEALKEHKKGLMQGLFPV